MAKHPKAQQPGPDGPDDSRNPNRPDPAADGPEGQKASGTADSSAAPPDPAKSVGESVAAEAAAASNPASAPLGGDFIQAEGPDIETSMSDADLSFLQSVSEGTAQQEPAVADSEHLADLRRVTADFANYRKRVERDRVVERERAMGEAARGLLPVLDDLDRAEKHGDLAEGGALTAIAAKLRGSAEKLGLQAFGEAGEPFDPTVHDAIFQRTNETVTVATVAEVVERGYRSGDTLLRPAKVVVDTPSDG